MAEGGVKDGGAKGRGIWNRTLRERDFPHWNWKRKLRGKDWGSRKRVYSHFEGILFFFSS